MLDRNHPPVSHPIAGFDLIAPRELTFKNGLKVFIFDAGEQDVIRMEWIFDHVFTQTENTLLHTCACEMLLEGTATHTSKQIAETVDFYGAFLVPQVEADRSTLSLFSLNKHLSQLLPLVREVLTGAVFPDQELTTYIRNNKQKLQVSLQKNSVVARRLFHAAVFGENRYGISAEISDYDHINSNDLRSLFKEQYQPYNCTLLLSGRVTDALITQVEQLFGDEWVPSAPQLEPQPGLVFPAESAGALLLEERQDALQSALRLGYRSISRSHPEFPGLQVVNTLLGGYFGSRLMTNIREDKGYTYSIGSGLVSLKYGAFFTIATEVGTAVTAAALSEIEKEILRLKTELVSEEELSLVKNYLMGSMLGSLENVFSHADKFKNAYFSGLGLGYYSYYDDVIRRIDAEEVCRLANSYLDYDRLTKIVVGKI